MVSGVAPDSVTVEFSIDGGPVGTTTVVDSRFVGWLPSRRSEGDDPRDGMGQTNSVTARAVTELV